MNGKESALRKHAEMIGSSIVVTALVVLGLSSASAHTTRPDVIEYTTAQPEDGLRESLIATSSRVNLLASSGASSSARRSRKKARKKIKRRPHRAPKQKRGPTKTFAQSQAPASKGGCPDDMVRVADVCMDRYEAPNRPGSLPIVMYTFYQAEEWCGARGKRLCYDDEWTRACQGPKGWNYPYGPTHRAGACNDDKRWLQYDRVLQRRWPTQVSTEAVEGLNELLTEAATTSPDGEESAEHIQWLYQADPSGHREGCGSYEGVFDLVGNVEEWVRRRDGGRPEFTNRLMGRFWAEQFHCNMTVSNHGNGFRFYEIGFRCCTEPR